MNQGDSAALYRIEFQGLSPRQRTVASGDWWRMPITGRPDRDYRHVVSRNGLVISDRTVTVACDFGPPQLGSPELQLVNACRDGRGYILFQFVNSSPVAKPYIIEFEGVPNRSTSAAAYGQAVRAVTGRPNGSYDVRLRSADGVFAIFTVTVDC